MPGGCSRIRLPCHGHEEGHDQEQHDEVLHELGEPHDDHLPQRGADAPVCQPYARERREAPPRVSSCAPRSGSSPGCRARESRRAPRRVTIIPQFKNVSSIVSQVAQHILPARTRKLRPWLLLRATRRVAHRVPNGTCGNATECRLSGVRRHFIAFPQVAFGTRNPTISEPTLSRTTRASIWYVIYQWSKVAVLPARPASDSTTAAQNRGHYHVRIYQDG